MRKAALSVSRTGRQSRDWTDRLVTLRLGKAVGHLDNPSALARIRSDIKRIKQLKQDVKGVQIPTATHIVKMKVLGDGKLVLVGLRGAKSDPKRLKFARLDMQKEMFIDALPLDPKLRDRLAKIVVSKAKIGKRFR